MKRRILVIAFFILSNTIINAQLPPVFKNIDQGRVRSSNLTTKYLTPQRIVWTSDTTGKFVRNSELLLKPSTGQADLSKGNFFTIINNGDSLQGIVLDFGREIQGGLEIVTTRGNTSPAGKVRIRFGESVGEAMSDVGVDGATNDHAMRDFEVTLPTMGRLEVGESGFRFVRIDLLGSNDSIKIKEISAIFRYRAIPYLGSFTCNDDRLNKIWMTGAYTVQLNMQNYLWDGIKRDRLVWIGDMHPEVMTINSVFGYNEVVPKSLDFAKEQYPLPDWMNGISSYSIWWILIQRDWYNYQGNLDYLKEQKEYLVGLLQQLAKYIDKDGKEILDGERFLDWPTSENKEATDAGLQALMVMAFKAGAELCNVLAVPETESLCLQSIKKLQKHVPKFAGTKQDAALLALAGLVSPEKADSEVLAKDGAHGMSTYYGYYMLKARAMAGDYQGALDNIRDYWGGMLDLGATTFWEDFDIDWMKNAARIDELTPKGKVNVHATYGNYCYKQYRLSLCHGWASGPTAWLTQYVLGVNVMEPGCKVIKLSPHLGDLQWVRGSFPTPYGILSIESRKMADGSVKTTYEKPEEIRVIVE